MIDLLIELEFKDNDIKELLETNKELLEYDLEVATNNIDILRKLKCNHSQIRNMIYTNSYFLDHSIIDLVEFLFNKGFTDLNVLFDSNPFLLSKEKYEMEEYITKQKNKGISLDEVIDLIEENPYVIEEEE